MGSEQKEIQSPDTKPGNLWNKGNPEIKVGENTGQSNRKKTETENKQNTDTKGKKID